MQWYVSQNGKTSGPFTDERISMLVNWGKISKEAYICDDKMSCWVSVTRSHVAPLIAEQMGREEVRESQAPPPLNEPPGLTGGSAAHRVAVALLIMLAAAAFLLALWLSPGAGAGGPLGHAQTGTDAAHMAALARPAPSHPDQWTLHYRTQWAADAAGGASHDTRLLLGATHTES